MSSRTQPVFSAIRSLSASALATSSHVPNKTGTSQVRTQQIKRPSLPKKPFLVQTCPLVSMDRIMTPADTWSLRPSWAGEWDHNHQLTWRRLANQWVHAQKQHFVTNCLFTLYMHTMYTHCSLHEHIHEQVQALKLWSLARNTFLLLLENFASLEEHFHWIRQLKNRKGRTLEDNATKKANRIHQMNLLSLCSHIFLFFSPLWLVLNEE